MKNRVDTKSNQKNSSTVTVRQTERRVDASHSHANNKQQNTTAVATLKEVLLPLEGPPVLWAS